MAVVIPLSPGFGYQEVPRTLCNSFLSYRCSSGTRRTDCTRLVPVSSMTMCSRVFTRTPTNTTLVHLVSNLCLAAVNILTKTRHLHFLWFSLQSHAGCEAMVWFTLVKSRSKLEQCSTSQASSGPRDSRAVRDCYSKISLRVLASPCTDWTARSTSPLLLLSPFQDASGTISLYQPILSVSQRATTLIHYISLDDSVPALRANTLDEGNTMALWLHHFPIARCLDVARSHQRFVQLVHEIAPQAMLSDPLGSCSNVLLRLSGHGCNLHSKVVWKGLWTDLLDAHHVY